MSLLIPSYQGGFASCAAESENPGLWDGLVGLWAPHLGPTGLTLYDWSGFGNDGTLNEPTWVTSRLGWVNGFDGGDDTIVVGTDYGRPTLVFSIAAWIKVGVFPAAGGNHDIIMGDTNLATLNRGWGLQLYDEDRLRFWLGSWTGDFAEFTPFTDTTEWHLVVGTYDGTSIKVYLDTELGGTVDTFAWTPNWTNATGLQFGQGFSGGDDWYEGLIGSSYFWVNRSLVLPEIQQLYAKPHALTTPRSKVYAAAVAVGNPWYAQAQQAG